MPEGNIVFISRGGGLFGKKNRLKSTFEIQQLIIFLSDKVNKHAHITKA